MIINIYTQMQINLQDSRFQYLETGLLDQVCEFYF